MKDSKDPAAVLAAATAAKAVAMFQRMAEHAYALASRGLPAGYFFGKVFAQGFAADAYARARRHYAAQFFPETLRRCLRCGHTECPGCVNWCDVVIDTEEEEAALCCGGECVYAEEP